jgi:hypothetical protein
MVGRQVTLVALRRHAGVAESAVRAWQNWFDVNGVPEWTGKDRCSCGECGTHEIADPDRSRAQAEALAKAGIPVPA